jgi:hypothetical protein
MPKYLVTMPFQQRTIEAASADEAQDIACDDRSFYEEMEVEIESTVEMSLHARKLEATIISKRKTLSLVK